MVESENLIGTKSQVCVYVDSVLVLGILNSTPQIDIHSLRGRSVDLCVCVCVCVCVVCVVCVCVVCVCCVCVCVCV